jgi:hypothetical protein
MIQQMELTVTHANSLGSPVPVGNKYRNLTLQVGRVSKIEITEYAHESLGTLTGERLHWGCPAKTENYRPDFSSKNSVASVRKRTIPTKRPPLVSEVSTNFLRIDGATWSA